MSAGFFTLPLTPQVLLQQKKVNLTVTHRRDTCMARPWLYHVVLLHKLLRTSFNIVVASLNSSRYIPSPMCVRSLQGRSGKDGWVSNNSKAAEHTIWDYSLPTGYAHRNPWKGRWKEKSCMTPTHRRAKSNKNVGQKLDTGRSLCLWHEA